jgi:AraC-like DNA-binding protein
MNHQYQKTDPLLAEYVRTVLVIDPDIECSSLPLFANGMAALICKAKNHIVLFGNSVPSDEWNTEKNNPIIAIFFKPFALGPIFRLSAHDLKEKPIELHLWNAQKAMTLNIQLYHSNSTLEKVGILQHFILKQIEYNIRDCQIIQKATDSIIQNSNAAIFPPLLRELNLSERTFQRIFKKYVGITANEYRRICQHYFAFSQLKGRHFEKLTDVAYANGYFDQSHFIRSFKEFTDTTPNEYLQTGLSKEV